MTAKIKNFRRKAYNKPKGISHKAFHKVYWPYLPLIALIGLMIGLSSQSKTFNQSAGHPFGSVLSYADTMSSSTLLSETNKQRAKNHVSNLAESSKLDAAAQAKADDMVTRNYWDHVTPDGQQPWIFVSRQDYKYQKLGENLAAGFSNEAATIDGWIASPPHKQNLLNSTYNQVGFGVAKSDNYTAAGGGPMTLVVAFYGKPSSASDLQTVVVAGASSGSETSNAQLAVATLPVANLATGFVVGVIFMSLSLWIIRHARVLKRSFATGEKFVVTHPLFDAGLAIIILLAFFLSRTAGLLH